MLWAAPGTGKTLLVLTMALAVAGGGNFLGWTAPKPRKVLLVDGEMAVEDLQERLEMLAQTVAGYDPAQGKKNLTIYSRTLQKPEAGFPDLGEREGQGVEPAGQDDIMAKARECGAELILLDNFSTLAEVSDENDAAAMSPTLAFLMRLKQARIGCVLVHHSGKGKNATTYRGSSKLATTFEVIIGLGELQGHDPTDGAGFNLFFEKYRRRRSEATRDRSVRLMGTGAASEWIGEISETDDMGRLLAAVQTCQYATQKALAAHMKETFGPNWQESRVTTLKGRLIASGRCTSADWATYLSTAREAQEEADGKPAAF